MRWGEARVSAAPQPHGPGFEILTWAGRDQRITEKCGVALAAQMSINPRFWQRKAAGARATTNLDRPLHAQSGHRLEPAGERQVGTPPLSSRGALQGAAEWGRSSRAMDEDTTSTRRQYYKITKAYLQPKRTEACPAIMTRRFGARPSFRGEVLRYGLNVLRCGADQSMATEVACQAYHKLAARIRTRNQVWTLAL